uniref:PhoD-like phosphatase metallophosphatase domain-containing protein n=1 Tax=Grammatophora oceanica TaxID=210454 RepID=A0A7S1YEB1_9STRA
MNNIRGERNYRYRVTYQPSSSSTTYNYYGFIPRQVEYPRVAAISCFGPDDTKDKTDLIEGVLKTEPDLIVLSGDHTYFSQGLGFGILETLYTLNRLTRNLPTVVQLDDHDYGTGNIWGAGNGDEESGEGFNRKPVCLVNALEQMTMGHHPDSATDETLDNGIGIYYTNYEYGNVDFAILESRKFKNRDVGDSMLGSAQEDWLRDWCGAKKGKLKVVLTQSPFAQLGVIITRWRKRVGGLVEVGKDKDTNGWPLEGRARFFDIIDGCSNLIIAGDQHLGIAVSYDDYGVMECSSPAAVNDMFWRMNFNELGETHLDRFGHPYRLLNVWNVAEPLYTSYQFPYETRPLGDLVKDSRADGFLVADLSTEFPTCEMHGYRQGQRMIWSTTGETEAPTKAPTKIPTTRAPVTNECSTNTDCGGNSHCALEIEEPWAPLVCCPGLSKISTLVPNTRVCRGQQDVNGVCSHNNFCRSDRCGHHRQHDKTPSYCCEGKIVRVGGVKVCRNSVPRGSFCTDGIVCESGTCISQKCH